MTPIPIYNFTIEGKENEAAYSFIEPTLNFEAGEFTVFVSFPEETKLLRIVYPFLDGGKPAQIYDILGRHIPSSIETDKLIVDGIVQHIDFLSDKFKQFPNGGEFLCNIIRHNVPKYTP